MDALSRYYSTTKQATYDSLIYAASHLSRSKLKVLDIAQGCFLLLNGIFAKHPIGKKIAYNALIYAASYLSREDIKVITITRACFFVLGSAFAAIGQPALAAVFIGGLFSSCIAPKLIQIYESRVQFAKLEPYFITQKRLTDLEKEITSKNYDEFLKIVKFVAEDKTFASILREAQLFPWFLSQVEKLIMNNAIDENLCSKLHVALSNQGAFSQKDDFISLVSKQGLPLPVHKFALLLVSSKYRQQTNSNYSDSHQPWLDCTTSSYKAIVQFDRYLSGLPSEEMPLEVWLDLLKMASYLCVNSLEKYLQTNIKINIEKYIYSIHSEKDLEMVLQMITSNIDHIGDDDWCGRAQYQALSVFFSRDKNFNIPCLLEEDRFSIPSNLLYLTLRKEYEILKSINCITFDLGALDFELQNLKLYPHSLEKFTSICFNNSCLHDNSEKVIALFPNLKTIYINVNDRLEIDLVRRLTEKHNNLQIKVVIYNDLLKESTKQITINHVGLFCNLVDKFQLLNINEKTQFLFLTAINDQQIIRFNNKYKIEGYKLRSIYNNQHQKYITSYHKI